MRIAVLSDIHGNRQAFEAVLGAVAEANVNEIWCLGDIVGYGAEPDACAALAADSCKVCLAGNHDLAVVGKLPIEEFSDTAGVAAQWTRATIEESTRNFICSLDPTAVASGVGLYHASPRDPVWEYILSELVAEMCFDASPFPLSLIGHSHVALSFQRSEESPATGAPREADEQVSLAHDRWFLNPGSVGQPRDGDPRAAWLLLDTDARTAQWCRTEYDIDAAAAAILAAGLPTMLAERLRHAQ